MGSLLRLKEHRDVREVHVAGRQLAECIPLDFAGFAQGSFRRGGLRRCQLQGSLPRFDPRLLPLLRFRRKQCIEQLK